MHRGATGATPLTAGRSDRYVLHAECRFAERALQRAAHAAALHRHGVAGEPVADGRVAGAAAGARAGAGGRALCRQADHRRRRAPGADAGPAREPRRLAGERRAAVAGRPAVGRVRARRAVGRADPRRLPGRRAAVGAGDQRLERQPDGARRHARPRGFRGRRVPGPARARAPPDQRPSHPDGAVARPGAGRGDGGELRRRPAGLCAVADRAAAGGAAAGVPGRAAFQRPGPTRSTSGARPSGASSTTCARRRRASRPPRK